MITKIVLENFKCFRKIEVEPRLVTVFVGPNGTGKSSVLQALDLSKHSAGRSDLAVQCSLIDLGDFARLLPKFNSRPVPLNLGIDSEHYASLPPTPNGNPGSTRVRSSFLSAIVNGAVARSWATIKFRYADDDRMLTAQPDRGANPEAVELPEGQVNVTTRDYIGSVLATSGFNGDVQNHYDRLNAIFSSPVDALVRMRVVPAARGLVQPKYELGTRRVEDIPADGGLSGQEQQLATNLAYGREHEAKLSEWLTRVTRVGLRGNLVESRAVEVEALTVLGYVNIVSEGFGANALISLFLTLSSAANGATVMIEEPEIHLHPRAQAELASLLAEIAKDEDKQLIMTTHSEHIVGRLLTLVAEKKLSSDDLAIYAFEKDDTGVCTAKELEVTDDGRVKGGIKDFFESDLDELDRYIKALQSSK